MESRETLHILAAIIILGVVVSLRSALREQFTLIPQLFLFSAIIILLSILSKKFAAYQLDANVEHEILTWQRFGFKAHHHLKKPLPIGIILPLTFSIFSLGILKLMTLLTYEARALKRRAARRHGFYSFTEMTDWHHALIGASGIFALLLLSTISYLVPIQGFSTLAKLATYYAFWNLLPLSKLDGTQILFGSRVLYSILAIITLIYTGYALFLP